jgi:DNA polymerase elongation subunit (family B)
VSARRYANVDVVGNALFVISYDEEGRRHKERIQGFEPWVGIEDPQSPEAWRTIQGVPAKMVPFPKFSEMRAFIKENGEAPPSMRKRLCYDVHPTYQYIARAFPRKDRLRLGLAPLRVCIIDIEVLTDPGTGFPSIEKVAHPVVAVCCWDSRIDAKVSWGLKPYEPSEPLHTYRQFATEKEMLKDWAEWFRKTQPDVVTGWNTDPFDIPYTIGRMIRFAEDEGETDADYGYPTIKRLSPNGSYWKTTKRGKFAGQEHTVYKLSGISHLDYLTLYQKHQPGGRESYSLGYIARTELGDTKLEYSGSLWDLYHSDHQKFMDYNAKDVDLVRRLDEKLKLIRLQATIAQMAGVNLEDVYSPVKTWEIFIYNIIHERMIAPPRKEFNSSGSYEGAYVKEPIPGMDPWVVSFDVVSEYPTCLVSNNISPEMKVEAKDLPPEVADLARRIREAGVLPLVRREFDTSCLKRHDLNMTAAGTVFRRGEVGIISGIIKEVFERRVAVRKAMKSAPEAEKAALDQEQYALKVLLNSLYGAYANEFFLYYDMRLAEAITITSQFYIRSIERAVNDALVEMFGPGDYIKIIDTDSIYVRLDKAVRSRFPQGCSDDDGVRFLNNFAEQVIQPIINTTFADACDYLNANTCYMAMKREKICRKVLALARKKYALLVLDSEGKRFTEPKVNVTGIEVVRSSTPEVVRGWLKKCLQLVFTTDNAELIAFVEKCASEFRELPFEVVAFPRTVNTMKREGEVTNSIPIQVRAALVHNRAATGKPPISNGDKIRYAYIEEPNFLRSDVFGIGESFPEDLRHRIRVDYRKQFERAFLSPLQAITSVIGWRLEEGHSLDGWIVYDDEPEEPVAPPPPLVADFTPPEPTGLAAFADSGYVNCGPCVVKTVNRFWVSHSESDAVFVDDAPSAECDVLGVCIEETDADLRRVLKDMAAPPGATEYFVRLWKEGKMGDGK